jgi:hypothetical protein
MKYFIIVFICFITLNAQAMAIKNSETVQNTDVSASLSVDDLTNPTEIKQTYVVGLVNNLDVANNTIVVSNVSYTLPEHSHLHLDKTLRVRSVVKMLVQNTQVIDLWILR